ncbi:MAG: hypothetical protein LUE98_04670 [Tannerellaceae bacterium]|nr:hypothetical protein [Tannerellaceae bacterium]
MNCGENILDIVRIEAYPFDAIRLPFGYSRRRTITYGAITITGDPVQVSLLLQSASLSSQRQEDAGGPYYTNTLQWQADTTNDDVLEQLSELENTPHHYIIYMYGGKRRLLYNESRFGKSLATVRSSDEENATISINIKSRLPLLAIKE